MSNPIPAVFDTGRRVARTIIQVGIPSFLALAGAVPVILDVVAHINLSPTARAALIATAAFITAAAGILTRIMAVPSVNQALDALNLGGHSGTIQAQDNYTTFNKVVTADELAAYNSAR